MLALTGGIGVKSEVRDGVYTGEPDGPFTYREGKVTAIKDLADEEGFDLAKSYAYSDSESDLPMLRAVGHPVAVNPDAELERIARAEGWRVMRFDKLARRLKVGAVLALAGRGRRGRGVPGGAPARQPGPRAPGAADDPPVSRGYLTDRRFAHRLAANTPGQEGSAAGVGRRSDTSSAGQGCGGSSGLQVLMAGCDDCATVNELPGATLNGPGEAEGGKPAVFTVRGQLGDGKACPQTVQFSYVELDAKGQELSTKNVLERGSAKVTVTDPPTAPGKPCKLVPLSRALTLPQSNQPRRYRVWASLSRPTAGKDFALDVASAPVVVTVRPTGTASPVPAANAAPVGDYIVDRAPAVAGATATFDARQSTDDTGIVKYEWDLYGDGDYERLTYTPQAQFTVGPKANGPLRMKLRVTDNGNLSSVYDGGPVPVVDANETFVSTSGPTVPATGRVNEGIAGIGSGQTTPTADKAELFCNEALVDTVTPPPNFFSATACRFSTPGFKTVAIRHSENAQNPLYAAASFYRLVAIGSSRKAQSSRARAAAKLTVPLRLTGVRIKKRGTVKKSGLQLTVKNTVVTGRAGAPCPSARPRLCAAGCGPSPPAGWRPGSAAAPRCWATTTCSARGRARCWCAAARARRPRSASSCRRPSRAGRLGSRCSARPARLPAWWPRAPRRES